ncbi:MAG: lipid-binding SYLF domain-containing protein [Alphaproteobacteria bacterium]
MQRPIDGGRRAVALGAAALVAAAAIPFAGPAQAQGYSEEQELIDRAGITFNKLVNDGQFRAIPAYLQQARGILIVPDLIKGGFIIGAEGGDGVLLLRQPDGSWSYPAFYTVGAGSIGFQIGVESKEVLFIIMNDGAVEAVLNDQAKVGVDLSGAFGPVGAGFEASTTTNFDRDIIAFSQGSGLFAGGAFEGSVIARRGDMNEAYYGPGASSRAITQQGLFSNPGAEPLRHLVGVYSR